MKLATAILIDDEPLALLDTRDSLLATAVFDVRGWFLSVAEAKKFLIINKQPIDFIFCDIEMPGCSGLEAVNQLRQYCQFFVFCTGHTQYAMDGHNLHVQGYLLKPIEELRVMQLLEKFQQMTADSVSQMDHQINHFMLDYIPVESELRNDKQGKGNRNRRTDGLRGREWIRVAVNEIAYLEKKGNYIHFYGLNEAKDPLLLGIVDWDIQALYDKYQMLENLFPISQSIIVNSDFISKVLPAGVKIGNKYVAITEKGRPFLYKYLRKVVPNYTKGRL